LSVDAAQLRSIAVPLTVPTTEVGTLGAAASCLPIA
jgi:hypothetical protein